MTQLERITSTLRSARGKCSISPRRNSTFLIRPFLAFSRALATISAVMSTPMTLPRGPTCRAARKQSNPPPAPRSSTISPFLSMAMACGFPQPSPMFASSGTAPSSFFEYPSLADCALADGAFVEQQDGVEQPQPLFPLVAIPAYRARTFSRMWSLLRFVM